MGNKCDRENERQVDEAESKEWARKYGAQHYHTSAKSGKGIEEAFHGLSKRKSNLEIAIKVSGRIVQEEG